MLTCQVPCCVEIYEPTNQPTTTPQPTTFTLNYLNLNYFQTFLIANCDNIVHGRLIHN